MNDYTLTITAKGCKPVVEHITDNNYRLVIKLKPGQVSPGPSPSSPLIAKYGETTYAEIVEALARGRVVYVDRDENGDLFRYMIQGAFTSYETGLGMVSFMCSDMITKGDSSTTERWYRVLYLDENNLWVETEKVLDEGGGGDSSVSKYYVDSQDASVLAAASSLVENEASTRQAADEEINSFAEKIDSSVRVLWDSSAQGGVSQEYVDSHDASVLEQATSLVETEASTRQEQIDIITEEVSKIDSSLTILWDNSTQGGVSQEYVDSHDASVLSVAAALVETEKAEREAKDEAQDASIQELYDSSQSGGASVEYVDSRDQDILSQALAAVDAEREEREAADETITADVSSLGGRIDNADSSIQILWDASSSQQGASVEFVVEQDASVLSQATTLVDNVSTALGDLSTNVDTINSELQATIDTVEEHETRLSGHDSSIQVLWDASSSQQGASVEFVVEQDASVLSQALAAVDDVSTLLAQETTNRKSADNLIRTRIVDISTMILEETAARESADSSLDASIQVLWDSSTQGGASVEFVVEQDASVLSQATTLVINEATERATADAELDASLQILWDSSQQGGGGDVSKGYVDAQDASLAAKIEDVDDIACAAIALITDEEDSRIAGDAALSGRIDSADSSIQELWDSSSDVSKGYVDAQDTSILARATALINQEATARSSGDANLYTNITADIEYAVGNERRQRQREDTSIRHDVSLITSDISTRLNNEITDRLSRDNEQDASIQDLWDTSISQSWVESQVNGEKAERQRADASLDASIQILWDASGSGGDLENYYTKAETDVLVEDVEDLAVAAIAMAQDIDSSVEILWNSSAQGGGVSEQFVIDHDAAILEQATNLINQEASTRESADEELGTFIENVDERTSNLDSSVSQLWDASQQGGTDEDTEDLAIAAIMMVSDEEDERKADVSRLESKTDNLAEAMFSIILPGAPYMTYKTSNNKPIVVREEPSFICIKNDGLSVGQGRFVHRAYKSGSIYYFFVSMESIIPTNAPSILEMTFPAVKSGEQLRVVCPFRGHNSFPEKVVVPAQDSSISMEYFDWNDTQKTVHHNVEVFVYPEVNKLELGTEGHHFVLADGYTKTIHLNTAQDRSVITDGDTTQPWTILYDL